MDVIATPTFGRFAMTEGEKSLVMVGGERSELAITEGSRTTVVSLTKNYEPYTYS